MIRKLLSAVVLTFSLTGCVGEDAPILIGNMRGFAEDRCAPAEFDTVRPIAGFLDVAGTTRYIQWVELASQLSPVTRQEGAGTASVTAPNEAVIDRVQLSYRVEGGGPALADESYPVHFVIQPGTGPDANVLGVDFFPTKAGEALRNVGPGSEFTVYATVRVAGRLRSGSRFTSSGATLPITVVHSGTTCGEGQVVALNGPCNTRGGQDFAPVVCCPEADPLCASTEAE
jgi:hypothetical protein